MKEYSARRWDSPESFWFHFQFEQLRSCLTLPHGDTLVLQKNIQNNLHASKAPVVLVVGFAAFVLLIAPRVNEVNGFELSTFNRRERSPRQMLR
jgi:hypothetical protein